MSMKMEVMRSFWLVIVVVLSFGATVVCGQNGLLSARCAARCLKEHRDSLRGDSDRNNHRKLIDRCKDSPVCFQCLNPCAKADSEKCANYCRVNETVCESSCHFLERSYFVKPGSCPRPETAVGFEAVCLRSCHRDGDCGEELKCCPNECGITCRQPDFTGYSHILPPVPTNLTFEERRQGKSLYVQWSLPQRQRGPNGILYVLEERNTTSLKPAWNHFSSWRTLLMTNSRGTLIRQVPAGHWFEFRVAAVTEAGSQGYTTSSTMYKSSRAIRKPSPPQNLTEGATTLRKGQVDVMIHWNPPRHTDLPVWKYTVIWSERLSTISPVLVRLPVLEKTVPGHETEFKLKNLKPGTTYSVQIEAIVQQGNRHLRSKLSSMMITTYAPPNPETDTIGSDLENYVEFQGQFGNLDEKISQDNTEGVISIYQDVIRVQKLQCSEAYYHQGVLKAFLTWKVGKEFLNIVKSYMIYWIPQSCDQDYAKLRPLSATSQETKFEVYDLQFECQYVIKVSAVTKKGVQGRPAATKLHTPVCRDILVKEDSLPPDCPDRESQVPRSPTVLPKIINNCTIDLLLSWGQPSSDLQIDQYHIKYGAAELFKKRNTPYSEPDYKHEPVLISLDSAYTNYTIKHLKESEHYVVQVFAQSSAGLGEPAYVEIWTPEILPCGSDKDPVPPDKSSTVTLPNTTQSLPVVGVTSDVGVAYTVSKTTIAINRTHVDNKSSKDIYFSSNRTVNIYRTIYYLFFIIYKLILRS